MYGKRRKRLSSALAESDVAQALLPCEVQYVFDGVGDVMPGEIVDAEIPELGRIWVVMDGLLRVLVSSIVPEPDVEALLDEDEGEDAVLRGQAEPDLAVHEETVMEVDDGLPGGRAGWRAWLASLRGKAMDAEEVTVGREDEVLFVDIAKQLAELLKVLGLADVVCEAAGV